MKMPLDTMQRGTHWLMDRPGMGRSQAAATTSASRWLLGGGR